MPLNDSEIQNYLAERGLEVVSLRVPRGPPSPDVPRLDSITELQDKLRSRDRGSRPRPAAPPATTNGLVMLRVRSKQELAREFTVVFSREHGAIVGEQD
jgi:hypothetical protein